MNQIMGERLYMSGTLDVHTLFNENILSADAHAVWGIPNGAPSIVAHHDEGHIFCFENNIDGGPSPGGPLALAAVTLPGEHRCLATFVPNCPTRAPTRHKERHPKLLSI